MDSHTPTRANLTSSEIMNGNNGRPHSYELRRTMATAPRRAAVDPGRLLTRSYIKVWLLSKCVPLKDAFQGTLRSRPNLDQAFDRKTELFQKKVPKKGPKTGSGWITHYIMISQFFHEFPGSLKFRDEMPGAGKRGVPGAYALRKNHKKIVRTGKL